MPIHQSTASSKSKSVAKRPFLQKRSVDAETTKPRVSKPGPKIRVPPPKPLAPATSGEEDKPSDASDAQSVASSDEETEAQVVPVKSSALATKSIKTKTAKVKATKPTSSKTAPHMVLFLSSLAYESFPAQPRGIAHYAINFDLPYEINYFVTRMMLSSTKIAKNNREYNSISSRVGLTLAIYYKILLVLRQSGEISSDHLKVLKVLEIAYPPSSIVIPSPYAHWIGSIGFHIPEDTKFDKVVPFLPDANHSFEYDKKNPKQAKFRASLLNTVYPTIPHAYALLELISNHDVFATGKDANDKDVDLHFDAHQFCIYQRSTTLKAKQLSFFGFDMDQAASATSGTAYMARNPLFLHPFYESASELALIKRHLRPLRKEIYKDGLIIQDSLDWFIAKQNTDWMAGPFRALEYEAKFFEGPTTLEGLEVTAGPEATCVTTMVSSATIDAKKWYQSPAFDNGSVSVSTKNRHVTTLHLQTAHSLRMITDYTATNSTGDLRHGFNSTTLVNGSGATVANIGATVETIFNEGYSQRGIARADYILGQHETALRSIMKKVSDVV